MSQKHKIGATFRLMLEDFTPEEWSDIYPFTSITAQIGQGAVKYPTVVTVDPDARQILITAETGTMRLGPAELDVRILKEGQTILIPADGVIKISLVKTITGAV